MGKQIQKEKPKPGKPDGTDAPPGKPDIIKTWWPKEET